MRRRLLVAGALLGTALASAAPLQAQGSGVMTHSSCATAMGFAGVARPCDDGSALLVQPGAMAQQRSVVGLGWTGITTGGSFTYDTTLVKITREDYTSSVPFGYANFRITDKLAAGIGAFNPYGLLIEWPDTSAFEGRYVSYRTDLKNIYVQPTLAYQLTPWLAVGAGLDVIFASIEINQYADLYSTPTTTPGVTFGNLGIARNTPFARVKLTGDGTGYTFNAGAVANFSPRFSMGVRYLHEATIDYDGDADFTQLNTGLIIPSGTPRHPLNPTANPLPLDQGVLAPLFADTAALGDQGVKTSLTLPAQLVVGVAIHPVPSLTLMADYQWTQWSTWNEAPIDFENRAARDQTLVLDYQDTDTYRFGAEWAATESLRLRGGFIYNTAAQKEFSVSSLLPEAERNYYSAGIGYRFGNGLAIDAGYQLVDQSDRRGRVRSTTPEMTDEQKRALNVGLYQADASVFNVTLSYRFGRNR